MEPKNVLDQNTRTVISTIKKENYSDTELKKILDSESRNRKRGKIIRFFENLFFKKEEEKFGKVIKKKNIEKKRISVKKLVTLKEEKKDDTLIDYKNSKGEPIKLKFAREYGGYKEYIDEKTNKKYSLGF